MASLLMVVTSLGFLTNLLISRKHDSSAFFDFISKLVRVKPLRVELFFAFYFVALYAFYALNGCIIELSYTSSF